MAFERLANKWAGDGSVYMCACVCSYVCMCVYIYMCICVCGGGEILVISFVDLRSENRTHITVLGKGEEDVG